MGAFGPSFIMTLFFFLLLKCKDTDHECKGSIGNGA